MTDKPGYRRPQEGTQPEYLHPAYQSTHRRSPSKPLVFLPHSLSEITGPTIGAERVQEQDNDLTAQHKGEPLGERIIIHGRVLDEGGLPDTSAKERLIASFDLEKTIPSYALGYRWDIVLRGREATPMEK